MSFTINTSAKTPGGAPAANVMVIRSFAALKKSSGAFARQQRPEGSAFIFCNLTLLPQAVAEAERAKKLSSRPVFIEGIGRSDLNRGATSLEPRLDEFYLSAQQAAAAQYRFNLATLQTGS